MSRRIPPILLETAEKTAEAWREFVIYLQFPPWQTYRVALQDAFADVSRACQSSGQLFVLTFRPLVLFSILVGTYLWALLRFLAKHGWVILQVGTKQLFYHAFVSARKGAVQLQTAIRWLIRWQKSLSRTSLYIELGAVVAACLLYLLRRHIIQQKYVARIKSSYQRTKRKMVQSYQRTVHRIAKVSLFLAMLLPHVIFGGFIVVVKTLFSSVLHWLACETYATSLISWWYPLVCTIATTYQLRTLLHEGYKQSPDENDDKESNNHVHTTTILKTPKSTKSRGTKTGVFPHTTPLGEKGGENRPPCASPIQRWMQAKETSSESVISEQARFWLSYWVIYIVFMALARICYLTPIFGRVFYKSKFWKAVGSEFQLVFFIWIFGLPAVLTSSAKTEKDFEGYEARPIQLLLRHVSPTLVAFQEQVSHAVPPVYWEQVVARSRNVLDLLVLVRLISKEFQAWLLHVVEEMHSLVIPSITLLMPGFITGYGVVYVQALAPAAKSCKALDLEGVGSLGHIRINLEYWVLNLLLAAMLEWLSPLLWWVPLSTHVTYLLWCHLSLPKTIEHWYHVFDQELQAFGILPRDEHTQLSMTETRTAKFLRALAKSLPKAADHSSVVQPDGANGSNAFSDAITQSVDKHDDSGDNVNTTPPKLKPDRDVQMQPDALNQSAQVDVRIDDSGRSNQKRPTKRNPKSSSAAAKDEAESSSSSESGSQPRRSTRARRAPIR